MIILPHDLTTQEIRVLQEFRRLNLETMTPEQIKAIKHTAEAASSRRRRWSGRAT